jgi:MOSC domain-containing protein YiiM
VGRKFSKISGVTIVDCDAAEAHAMEEQFRSASIPKIIPEQLQLAGWTLLQVPTGRKVNIGRALVDETREAYLCPRHKPKGRMSGGPPPLSTMGRTSH